MKKKVIIIIFFVLTFICGTIFGVLISRHIHHKIMGGFLGPDKVEHKERILKMFSRKLDLNEEQKIKLGDILDKHKKRLDELRDTFVPNFKKIHEEIQKDIKGILNSDQIEQFDKMTKRFERHMPFMPFMKEPPGRPAIK